MAVRPGTLLLLRQCWLTWKYDCYRVLLLGDLSPAWYAALLELLREQDLLTAYNELKDVLAYDPQVYDAHHYTRQLQVANLPRQHFSFFMLHWSTRSACFRRAPLPPVVHLVVGLLHLLPVPGLLPLTADEYQEYCMDLGRRMEPFAREGSPFLLLYPIARRDDRLRGAAPSSGSTYPATFLLFAHSDHPDLVAQFRRGRSFLKDTALFGRPSAFAKRCELLALDKLRKVNDPNLHYHFHSELIELCNTAPFFLEQF